MRAGESALLPGRGSAAAVEEGGGEGAGLRTLVRTCQQHLGSHLDVSGKTMMSPSSPVVPVLAGGLAVSMLTLTISVSPCLCISVYLRVSLISHCLGPRSGVIKTVRLIMSQESGSAGQRNNIHGGNSPPQHKQ